MPLGRVSEAINSECAGRGKPLVVKTRRLCSEGTHEKRSVPALNYVLKCLLSGGSVRPFADLAAVDARAFTPMAWAALAT